MPRGEFDRSGKRARTRAALLEAAARVYARRGFDSATIDEVADEAGYTKGAVYDHFGSKEKLLFALLEEHLNVQMAEQVELFDPARAPADRPRVGGDRWFARVREDPDAFRLFVEAWVHGQRDEELGSVVAAGIEQWRSMLQSFGRRRIEALGEPPRDEVLEQTSTVMVALGIGLAMIALAEPERVDDRLLGAVAAVLIGAVEGSPEAREALEGLTRRTTPS
jgi:AcrR family transcriptional regulator